MVKKIKDPFTWQLDQTMEMLKEATITSGTKIWWYGLKNCLTAVLLMSADITRFLW